LSHILFVIINMHWLLWQYFLFVIFNWANTSSEELFTVVFGKTQKLLLWLLCYWNVHMLYGVIQC